MLIGYVRASTHGQTQELQKDALKKAGCEMFFSDVVNESTPGRPGFDEMLKAARPGDTIVVLCLAQLRRNAAHLLELIAEFQERKIKLKSLKDRINISTRQDFQKYKLALTICDLGAE